MQRVIMGDKAKLPEWMRAEFITEYENASLTYASALREAFLGIPEEHRATAMRIAGICSHCFGVDKIVDVNAMPCQCWNDE